MAPPDLRRVVRRFEVPLTRRRFAAPESAGAGLQVRGLPEDTAIRSVVWPTDKPTTRDPSGGQDTAELGGVSRYEVRSVETSPIGVADVLVLGGRFYEVTLARAWVRRGAVTQFWEWAAVQVDLELDYGAAVAMGPGLGMVAS